LTQFRDSLSRTDAVFVLHDFLHIVRRCESLLPPPNGVIVGQCPRVILSVCRMQCYAGYLAVGSEERKCDLRANNVMEWTGSPLQCVARRCEFLFPPANGIIVGQCLREYSSVCRMQCYEGYEAVGSVERKCDVSANNVMEWTGSPLQCVVIRCPALSVAFADPPSGVCTSPSLQYNTRCTFACQAGYSLKGCKERVCQLDKSWSGNPTSCVG